MVERVSKKEVTLAVSIIAGSLGLFAASMAGIAIRLGDIENHCREIGQVRVDPEHRLLHKTEVYDPRTECRILFGEDENGQLRGNFDLGPRHW